MDLIKSDAAEFRHHLRDGELSYKGREHIQRYRKPRCQNRENISF